MSQAAYVLAVNSAVPYAALAAMRRAEQLVELELGLLRSSYLRSFASGPVTNPPEGVPVIRGPFGAGGFLHVAYEASHAACNCARWV